LDFLWIIISGQLRLSLPAYTNKAVFIVNAALISQWQHCM